MASSYVPWLISAVWLFLMLLTFVALDVTSVGNWVLVTTVGLVPSMIMLRSWHDRHRLAAVEVLHVTESRR